MRSIRSFIKTVKDWIAKMGKWIISFTDKQCGTPGRRAPVIVKQGNLIMGSIYTPIAAADDLTEEQEKELKGYAEKNKLIVLERLQ